MIPTTRIQTPILLRRIAGVFDGYRATGNGLAPVSTRPATLLQTLGLFAALIFLPLLALAVAAYALGVDPMAGLALATTPVATPKELRDEIMGAFETFKNANDERLKQIEAKGSADAALVNKMENANKAITDLTAKLAEVEKLAARPQFDGEPSKDVQAERSAARQFVAMRTGVRPDEVPDSAVSVDEYREYKNAFVAMMRRGDKAVPASIQASLSVGSNPEGGYWVPPDTAGRIVEFVRETSPMRAYASVQETQSNDLEGWTDIEDVAVNTKVGEKSTRTGDTETADLGKWKIPVHEIDAEPRATQRMLDMSIRDPEGWLAQKVGRKIGRSENTAFVVGSGVGEARGFTTYPAGTPTGTAAGWPRIQQINSGAAADFHATNPGDAFIDAMHALKSELRAGAVWAMNSLTLAKVRKFKDGQGNYLWIPSIQAGTSGLLLGHPVAEFADMADVAANALAVAFANFREGYQIVDGAGIRMLRDNLTLKGWVKFYTTKRYGGDVVNFEAIKLIKISA